VLFFCGLGIGDRRVERLLYPKTNRALQLSGL